MRVEIRTCIKCGETKEIEQKHTFKCNICRECRNKKSNEYNTKRALANGRRQGTTGRVPYPLSDEWHNPSNKFRALASKMFKIKDRDKWIEEIKINLDNTLSNQSLMDWINAHKDDKPNKRIKKKPDTRSMTWEEWEEGGWGDDSVDD